MSHRPTIQSLAESIVAEIDAIADLVTARTNATAEGRDGFGGRPPAHPSSHRSEKLPSAAPDALWSKKGKKRKKR